MTLAIKEYPAVRILLCLVFGIILRRHLDLACFIPAAIVLSILIGFGTFLNGYKRPIVKGLLFSASLFLFGFIRMDLKENFVPQNHFEPNEQVLIGTVQEEITKKNKIKTILKIEYHQLNDSTFHLSNGNLLIYLDSDIESANLIPGDRIIFQAYIQPTQENLNPHAFDYKAYLHLLGIDYQAFIKSSNWKLLDQNNLPFIQQTAFNIRSNLLNTLRNTIKSKEEFSICAALVLGYRNELSKDLYKTYQQTGAVHVLAVSGLHLGILTQILFFLFGFFPSTNRFVEISKAILIIILIWMFALVTGAAPAVLRAATMFSLFIIGKNLFKDVNTYNILASSAILLLLYDPSLLFQVGFQLSYFALLSIIYFHPIISSWYVSENKFVQYIWNLMVVSIAAQILVFPITTHYFHQFPMYFILSGIIAVPMAAIILSTTLLLFLCHFLVPTFNQFLGPFLEYILKGFLWSMRQIQELPFCSLSEILLRKTDVVLFYAMLLLLIIWINTSKKKMIYPILASLAIFVFINIQYLAKNLQRKEFIVYQTSKGIVLDFFIGRKCYELTSANVSQTAHEFSVYGNRLYKKIEEVIDTTEPEITDHQSTKWQSGIFSIDGQSILHLPNDLDFNKYQKVKVDYLLVGNIQVEELDKLITQVQFSELVITNESKYWNQNKIQELLRDKNISFHSIENDGPFIRKL